MLAESASLAKALLHRSFTAAQTGTCEEHRGEFLIHHTAIADNVPRRREQESACIGHIGELLNLGFVLQDCV